MSSNNNNSDGSSSGGVILIVLIIGICCCFCLCIGGLYTFQEQLCSSAPELPLMCLTGTPTSTSSSSADTSSTPPPSRTTPPAVRNTKPIWKTYFKYTSADPKTLHSTARSVTTDAACRKECTSNSRCGGYARTRTKNSSGKYECWLKSSSSIKKKDGKYVKDDGWNLYVKE